MSILDIAALTGMYAANAAHHTQWQNAQRAQEYNSGHLAQLKTFSKPSEALPAFVEAPVCRYCGRGTQPSAAKTCYGCAAPIAKSYGKFMGRHVTDPAEACELMKQHNLFYGFATVTPEVVCQVQS